MKKIKNQPAKLGKALTLSFVFVIPSYILFLILYLTGLINSFIFLGALILMMIIPLAILLLFRKRKFIFKTTIFSFILTGLLFGYEARLLSYVSVTYLVDSYREPEELLPNSNLYILSVGLHDIHYVQGDKMLLDTLEANDIQPLEIVEVKNTDRYAYKTTDILSFLGFDKKLFNAMGTKVQHFLGEDPHFMAEFLKRENLHGDSAGLILGLYALMDRRQFKNNIPIGITGTLEKNGDVLEVGGIHAKMMIAAQNNFPHIVIPADNLQEAERVKSDASLNINIIPVEHIDDAVHIIQDLNKDM